METWNNTRLPSVWGGGASSVSADRESGRVDRCGNGLADLTSGIMQVDWIRLVCCRCPAGAKADGATAVDAGCCPTSGR
ncbi:hypothetical protein HPP92_000842 [Vanilla planifolia]|uniref:Uncharacterized protein n=1 Tax=Vanilla planifolia TaxID=51239 RepID=A0A835VKU8_VANPL|nr:hypothetical protein HPP92_000842 [Vanilla planifolia]